MYVKLECRIEMGVARKNRAIDESSRINCGHPLFFGAGHEEHISPLGGEELGVGNPSHLRARAYSGVAPRTFIARKN